MPRNGSGTYSLPQASFVPGTTISSSAVNSDFSDIATALTSSISADGQTPITAPLKQSAGTLSTPSWTFVLDVSAGLYLPAVGEVGLVAGSVGITVDSTATTATAAAVQAGGTSYAVGDTITLTGGTFARAAVLTVATLSGSAVASVTVTDGGLYSTSPGNPVSQGSTSGSGTGATFNLTLTTAFAVVSAATGTALWTALGATSYMATAMIQKSGTDLANYIGAAALAAAIQSSLPVVTPRGYLTLTSGTPVITSDVTGASSVFYTPYVGNLVPIYNGTFFISTVFPELTLTLNNPAHAANGIYDVFIFNNSGSAAIGTGPVWTGTTPGSCTRGSGAGTTQISRLNGIFVNTVAITLRNGASTFSVALNQATYVGSIWIDNTNAQTSCHITFGQNRKFGVWNCYNRTNIMLKSGQSGGNWGPGANRAFNAQPASYTASFWNVGSGTTVNGSTPFVGLTEERVVCRLNVDLAALANAANGNFGIVVNNITNAGLVGTSGGYNAGAAGNGFQINLLCDYSAPLALGLTNLVSYENCGGSVTAFTGENGNCLYTQYRG